MNTQESESGCHKCKWKPRPGQSYDRTRCASCKMAEERYEYANGSDPADWNRGCRNHPANIGDGESGMTIAKFHARVFEVAASIVRRLVNLKETHPDIYDVVMLKMEHPDWSYADIGAAVYVTKQMVDYHLRQSVKIIPELAYAFLIDSRFSSGAGKLYQDLKDELAEVKHEKYS